MICVDRIRVLNKNFNIIKADKRSTIRVLESVNLRIIKAEDYFAKLEVQKKELEGKVSDLETLGNVRDDLEANIEVLRNKNNELMGNREQLRSQIAAISKTLQSQITEAHEKMVLYETKANTAESKMHNFVNEYVRKTRDLEIMKKRVEAVYAEVFPGAKVNLQ